MEKEMKRFMVEFEREDGFDLTSEETQVGSGSMLILAETLTDAAWHVKFMLPSGCEVKSVKRH